MRGRGVLIIDFRTTLAMDDPTAESLKLKCNVPGPFFVEKLNNGHGFFFHYGKNGFSHEHGKFWQGHFFGVKIGLVMVLYDGHCLTLF